MTQEVFFKLNEAQHTVDFFFQQIADGKEIENIYVYRDGDTITIEIKTRPL